ncbi:hypothetical protein 5 [Hubei picorna-like virus 75]|uniref:hypothetical protein 5 n=1 Tax=Hubei picorna-like virus 75 TaxID=1923159 RepID=UPI00090BE32A|nr:hypothetical protein 5 [Hubei picorna-like virus 75]APG78370.1 hypothetical protein 5 [Hubei picorna-like virus 75]
MAQLQNVHDSGLSRDRRVLAKRELGKFLKFVDSLGVLIQRYPLTLNKCVVSELPLVLGECTSHLRVTRQKVILPYSPRLHPSLVMNYLNTLMKNYVSFSQLFTALSKTAYPSGQNCSNYLMDYDISTLLPPTLANALTLWGSSNKFVIVPIATMSSVLVAAFVMEMSIHETLEFIHRAVVNHAHQVDIANPSTLRIGGWQQKVWQLSSYHQLSQLPIETWVCMNYYLHIVHIAPTVVTAEVLFDFDLVDNFTPCYAEGHFNSVLGATAHAAHNYASGTPVMQWSHSDFLSTCGYERFDWHEPIPEKTINTIEGYVSLGMSKPFDKVLRSQTRIVRNRDMCHVDYEFDDAMWTDDFDPLPVWFTNLHM